jgi:lipid-binding SYLF domain-containing protein
MKGKKLSIISVLAAVLVVVGLLVVLPATAAAAGPEDAQAIVDRARVTFDDFMKDQHYTWLHDNLSKAKGLLIFPQVLKAGFILGGSGGTGVLVLRDEKTCNWSEPAFYTLGSVTFGLQIGGESAEVLMMVMSQKAVDSLLASSFKLGGDASVALGPIGEGAKSNITADFISFAKSKGIYAGLNLEGSVVSVRDSINSYYYGREVRPADIIVKRDVDNSGSRDLLTTLKKLSPECSS